MESAEEFAWAVVHIARTITFRNGEEWEAKDEIQQMLTAHDAAIRAECAKRAIAWCDSWNGYQILQPESGDTLRAAIMGEPPKAAL